MSPAEDGRPYREHYLSAQKNVRKKIPELEQPPFPHSLFYLWVAYWELRKGLGNNGMGVQPVGWQDIKVWSELMQTPITPWEAQTLRKIDNAYLAVSRKSTQG